MLITHEVSVLSSYETRLLAAISESLLPKTALLDQSPDNLMLGDRIERHLSLCTRTIRWVFRMTLWWIELGPLLTRGLFWSRLNADRKADRLEAWRTSRFYLKRLLFKLIESTIYMTYYSEPGVCKRLGYEPPPIRQRVALPPHRSSSDRDLSLKADVCVIGSGAGGAVVAKELSEKGRSVVLIEEGGYFSVNDFGVEALEIVEKIYHNAGTQMTLGAPCIILPTGRAVGGTTIINSGTCFRLPDKVVSHWRDAFGLTDISSEGLAPYFDKVERQLHVVPVGEDILGNNSKIFRRGLESLGHHGFPLPRNVRNCSGAGMCCFGCPTDAKQSVNVSYIPQAVTNGTQLFTNCRVEQIIPKLSHGGEVIGRFIDPRTGQATRSVRVDAKVVVLAAGTLNSPRLLRKNRIALHNRHIGRHLTIHPTGKIIGVFDEEVRAWEGVPQGFCYDGMADEDIMFEGAFTPPSFAAVSLSTGARDHKDAMEHYRNMASFGFLMSDEGRGWIRWLPNGEALIYYSIRRRELQKLVKGIRFLCEVFLAAGSKKIYTGIKSLPVVTPESGLRGFDEVTIRRTDLDIAAFHPLGTCRMGADAANSVVDGFGEVHGVKNLFIADGSIFPSSLGVNPQETIMAFANRTADRIHQILS